MLSPEIRSMTRTRISALTTSIQHCSGNSRQDREENTIKGMQVGKSKQVVYFNKFRNFLRSYADRKGRRPFLFADVMMSFLYMIENSKDTSSI